MRPGLLAAAALLAMATASPASAEPSPTPAQSTTEPTYRTMCVRTCDGFFFPIHTYAVKSSFADDAKACRAACSSDAVLYYFPTFGGAVATMVNSSGQSYADHPKAFSFRKAMSPECTCRAPAWSPEEKSRHAEYARLEAIEVEKDRAFLLARTAAEAGKKSAETTVAAAAAQPEQAPKIEPVELPAANEAATIEPTTPSRPQTGALLARGEADYDFTTMRRPQRAFRILQQRTYGRLSGDRFAAW